MFGEILLGRDIVYHLPLLSTLHYNLDNRHRCPPSVQCLRISNSSPRPMAAGLRCRVTSRRRFKAVGLSRCSITNADVQLSFVASDDTVDDNLSSPILSCNDSIGHFKSEALDAEPLNLSSTRSYVDNLLTTLPVLTEEEQTTLAAMPAHPAGLYALYANCFVGCLVEQLWSFAWPAAIAMAHPSLLPVAVMSFFTKLAIVLGGPLVGKFMDRFPRLPAYNSLNFIQASAQMLSAMMIIRAHSVASTMDTCVLLRPWFLMLTFAGAVERLSGLALGVAVERDWVVLLAGTNRPIALAKANAIMSRIDLVCEILGASLFGILLSNYNTVTCLKLAVVLMLLSIPLMFVLTWLTNKLSAGVLDSAKCQQEYSESSHDPKNIVDIGISSIKHGWTEYLQQPVLPASIAYVLLYFNVVLAPGGLMTAFLTHHGLNSSIIGGFSGLCAFMGVAATFLSAALVRRLGILKAGAAGLIFHALLLTVAVTVYLSGFVGQEKGLLFFLCLIALSRLGHMSYDVVGAQILQTGIPSSKANLIGTTEVAVASMAEFIMLGVAIVANDVSHFGILASLSLLSVVGAASVFCRWLSNPTDEHRKLFCFDRPF